MSNVDVTDSIISRHLGGAASRTPAPTAAPEGAAKGKGHETEIMRAPKRIRWNLPDYNHTKLIYIFWTDYQQLETSTFASDANDLVINLNGCHDLIETNALYTAIRDNITTATTANTSASNQPKGWNFWNKIYNHYTVLNCEYDITMTVTDVGQPDTDGPLGVAGSDVPTSMLFFGAEVGASSNAYDASALEIMTDLSVKHTQVKHKADWIHYDHTFGASNDLAYTVHRPVYQQTFSGS